MPGGVDDVNDAPLAMRWHRQQLYLLSAALTAYQSSSHNLLRRLPRRAIGTRAVPAKTLRRYHHRKTKPRILPRAASQCRATYQSSHA